MQAAKVEIEAIVGEVQDMWTYASCEKIYIKTLTWPGYIIIVSNVF